MASWDLDKGKGQMRVVLLLTTANIAAFALGVVVTLWVTSTPNSRQNAIVTAPAPLQHLDEAGAAITPGVVSPTPAPVSALPLSTAPQPTHTATPLLTAVPTLPASQPLAPESAVRVETASAPASVVATGPVRPSYVIQLATFRLSENAKSLQAAALRKGFKAVVVPAKGGRTDWFVVRIPGFDTFTSATTAVVQLQQDLGIGGIIMRDPG